MESEGTGAPNCQGVPQTPRPGTIPNNVVACHAQTMASLALLLPQIANAYVTSSVIDQTGLKGTWDFEIKWTGRGQLAAAGADGISMFDAIDKQLGLKLELQTVPLSVIRVDSVNQKPTENPPGVATILPPPPPAEFEVADVKPTAPGATNQMLRLQPTGRLDAQNIPLKDLISLAWDFNSDDMLAGLPKFAETSHFDIVAKAVVTPGEQIDIDALRAMLRKLLIDRFKMTVHMEDRPVSAYTLSALKPKLTKADPSNRTGSKEGPGPHGKDRRIANPVFNRLLYCQNMSMAQFAEQLPIVANGYVHSGVWDSTGLDGAYDFTLNFSGIGLVQGGGGRGGDAPSGAVASDPNGALSLPDAVSKQLGLKLELQKRPIPVLVIDHVEETPTGN